MCFSTSDIKWNKNQWPGLLTEYPGTRLKHQPYSSVVSLRQSPSPDFTFIWKWWNCTEFQSIDNAWLFVLTVAISALKMTPSAGMKHPLHFVTLWFSCGLRLQYMLACVVLSYVLGLWWKSVLQHGNI